MTASIELGFRPSPQQLRAWRLQKDGPASCSVLCSLSIEGDLDRRALRQALGTLVERHEILRTAFRLPAGLSLPLQVILEPRPVSLPEVDFGDLSPEHRKAGATALLRSLGGPPFDLERGEGWRAALVRLGPRQHEMLFALSAACADPDTFRPLAADLLAAYTRQVKGGGHDPKPPLQYADVAEWQNSFLEGEDAAEGIETWRERWKGHDLDTRIALPLPLEESEMVPGPFAPRETAVPLGRETAAALARLAGAWGCPPQVLLLTAWKAMLQRGTGRDETLVGVLCSGREAEELRQVVGPLARYLPIATRVSPESPLRDAAGQVRQAMEEAEPWAEYFSWDHVTGNGHGTGGFTVCFEAVSNDWELSVDGLRVAPSRLPWNSAILDSFTLALSCHGEGEDLRLALRYDPRRFSAEAARRLAGRLAALLGSVAARPEAPLAEHPAIAQEEWDRWLELSVAPPAAGRGREGKSLAAVFEEQVDRSPKRLAVVAGDGRLSFRELDERANRLAHHLRAAGAGPEVPVALCLERSAEAVMAILAVWKAGAFYVPLDPTQPAERLAYILSDTAAPLLVTDSRLAPRLPAAPGVRAVRLDEESEALARQPADRPAGEAGPRNLAYTIYTSGSTGRPKGVQVEHRSPLHLLAALEAAVLDPLAGAEPLLASLNAPMIFDASVQQLVLLLAGHALCVVPQEVRADGAALVSFLGENGVELLDCTPSQLRVLVEAGLLDGPASPRIVLTAGEAVDEPLWRRLAQAERTVSFNLYGPTECSVDATFHRVEPGSTEPTIGRPLAGYEVFLLDRALRAVPPGAPGELCLGGLGLARGYLGRPDLTAERFVPHPFSERPGERLYRTGDLGRHRPEGTLEFLGRLDFQVKIRGFRIELGEIEAALVALDGVREAVVVAREDAPGDLRLVAYAVGDVTADALRQSLRERLPDYMVPAAFVTLPALPLTPNGKVDRKALPAPEWHGGEEGYVAPRTPVEEILAGIWAELLGLERVGAADHFFERGGHSLLATQVMSRLRGTFGVEMPLRALFEAPVLADLAVRVEAARQTGPALPVPPLVPVPREEALPLSFAQQRLWFIDQLEPGTPLYNIPVVLRAGGPLRLPVLELCLGEVARRHEALRTVFAAPAGSPVQVIQPAAPFVLPVVDLSGLAEDRREALVLALAGEEAGRPFDLARGPLLRGMLLRLAEDDHVATLTLHHIVSDGWSMGILVREVMALYAAFAGGRPSPLPELPLQYADFAAWQRSWLHGEALESEISYWRAQLAGLPPLLELPTDRPRPAVQGFRGASRPVRLPAELTREIETLGRREGATLFMVLLAGFQAILSRYSGQQDLAVGTPVAGRNRMEIEGLIGLFVNTLVLRGDLAGGEAGEPSFRELLGRVRDTALAAHAHQDVPFERLVQELSPERSLAHAPLFQVMLTLQNAPAGTLEIPNLRLRPVDLAGATSRFDLTLSLGEHDGGLSGGLSYATDLFDAATVDRLIGHFERLLAAAAVTPDLPISALPFLSPAEMHGLVREAGRPGTATGPEGALPERCVHELFAEQAARTPGVLAVVDEERAWTYADLHRRVRRLALRLRAAGVGPDQPVMLCAERGAGLVAGLLGILEAGGAYLAVEPDLPRARQELLAGDAQVTVAVTEGRLAATLPAGLRTVSLDDGGLEGVDGEPAGGGAPRAAVTPGHLAYVLYTSGSTGTPKGVMVEHRQLTAYVRGALERLAPPAAASFATVSSFAADLGHTSIFTALLGGGCLHVVARERLADAAAFAGRMERQPVDVLKIVPSHLAALLTAERPERSLPRRLLVLGGEPLPWSLVERVRALAPECRLFNHYGPTETTVGVLAGAVEETEGGGERGSASAPLGGPLGHTRVWIVDRHHQLVPAGVPGELCVGGPQVTRGYLGRPGLTAERFIPDPFGGGAGERLYRTGDLVRRRPDGPVEFLGRTDHQVKVRGFRVELGEIQAALAALPGVREALVVLREDTPGDRRLVAYMTGDVSATAADTLRRSLRERLPEYMVPAAFVTLAAFPLTPNGKVDRKALPAPERQGVADSFVAPRTLVEEILAGTWAELLDRERVGADDHFFELGGHSLLATRVVSRLRDAFDVEMPLRDLFEAPRLSDFAARVEAARRTGAVPPAPPLVPVPPQGPLPLSFAQQRLWFIDKLQPGTSLYNVPVVLRGRGSLRIGALELCLGEVVRRHGVLRTVFAAQEGSPVQVIQPPAPFAVPVVDLSGLPEREREALAVTLAREETGRPFDLACGPLLRCVLLRLAEDHHIAALTMHHIVSDGWSRGILVREVMALYKGLLEEEPPLLPELPIQYADFAVWQHRWLGQEVLEGLVDHWRRHLAGAPPQLDLPGARPRPAVLSPRGAARLRLFSFLLLEQLRVLGRRESATLFMALLAPLQALIHSRTGATDLVVGTDVAGRDRRETEGLIGFFINQLPLRADLSGDPTLRQLLGRVRETALEAYAHQDLPFDHLVEALRVERSLQRSPVFQVKLVLQNVPRADLDLPGLSLEVVPSNIETAQLDLHWSFAESDEGLWLTLTYSTDLYDESLIDSLLDEYEGWLHAFVERPESRLGEVAAELAQAGRARRAELDTELRSVGLSKLRSRRRQVVELEGEPQGMEVG